MNRMCFRAVAAAVAACALTACQSSKSSNPLSPTVAGPIPGVNITAPTTVTPTSGAKIAVDQQPMTLTVQNASTNGVRPLNYAFEVATDAGFNNKVFSRDGITPGERHDGLDAARQARDRTHLLLAREAQDGAEHRAVPAAVNFNVFTPIVIQQPGPVAPSATSRTDSLHPQFSSTNAPRSGPVGAISYVLEVSDIDSFANKIGSGPSPSSRTRRPDRAAGSELRQAVLLARARIRPDDDRPVVGDTGVRDAGDRRRSSRWRRRAVAVAVVAAAGRQRSVRPVAGGSVQLAGGYRELAGHRLDHAARDVPSSGLRSSSRPRTAGRTSSRPGSADRSSTRSGRS